MQHASPLPLSVLFAALLAGWVAAKAPAQAYTLVPVRNFGAIPNDNVDDTLALQRAWSNLLDNQSLEFEPGQYDLFQVPFLPQQFRVYDRTDIRINGNDATLMLHGFDATDPAPWAINQLFGFSNCQGVTVAGFTIEMSRAPFSCGTVSSVTSSGNYKVVDVVFPAEFPVSASIWVAALLRHRPDGRPWGEGCDLYWGDIGSPNVSQPRIASLGNQALRFLLPGSTVLAIGDKITVRHRNYGCNAITAWDCTPGPGGGSALTVDNTRIFTIPGMGVYASNTEGVTLRAFQVFRTPSSNRLISTTADATHFHLCKGTISLPAATRTFAPTVLEGMGDDGLNVHGSFSEVVWVNASQTLVRVGAVPNIGSRMVYQVGDVVGFYDSSTLLPTGRATVVDARESSGQLLLNLGPNPVNVAINNLATNLTRYPAVRIDGVTVADNRGRGFVIQTRDVEIRNSLVERCTGSGIHVRCDAADFYEGVGTADVLIKGNTLSELNNGAVVGSPLYTRAAISISADVRLASNVYGVGVAGSHQRVTLDGNTIRNTTRPAVHVGAAFQTTVINNLFDQVCTAAGASTPAALACAIWVENSLTTGIFGNTLVPDANGTRGVGDLNSQGTVVAHNTGF